MMSIRDRALARARSTKSDSHMRFYKYMKNTVNSAINNEKAAFFTYYVNNNKERIVCNQLTKYIEEENILPDVQPGFRKGYGTATALAHSTDDIISTNDAQKGSILVQLDFTRAFDCLDPELLVAKLAYYGVERSTCKWFKAYLSNRKQFVEPEVQGRDAISEIRSVDRGCPQGSILGPLLFVIYTADLGHLSIHGRLLIYADDTQLHYPIDPKDTNAAVTQINEYVVKVLTWANNNRLLLNSSKAKYTVLVAREDTPKSLGVLLDPLLRYEDHINSLIRVAFFKLKTLYGIRRYLSQEVRVIVTEAIILSHFNYCDTVYGPRLFAKQRVQNACARFCLNVPKRAHITPFLIKSNSLKMKDRRNLHLAGQVFKLVKARRPTSLYKKLEWQKDSHLLNTRSKDKLQLKIPKHKTSGFQGCFKYAANATAFDYIVIGGGTAGATIAARLSELRDYTILLVEAGGDPPTESIIPGFHDAMKTSSVDWNFITTSDNFSSQALLNGSQRQPRGKMLGGSGSINDMIYSRGFPADYEEWATVLGEDWSWSNVLEYFKKTEHLTDERFVNDAHLTRLHGFGGEIEVAGISESPRATDKFLDAFKELGFKLVKDMTNPDSIGAGRFSHTIRDGKRDSSATALLNKAKDRDNLYVLKNALVAKILIEQKKAYGIAVSIENKTYHYYAKREVVLSAGTFNSAKLLLLSGIGPKEHLREMHIDVVANLPVGYNLHDHVMVLNFLAAEEGTCHSEENERYLDIVQYLYDRRGFFRRTSDLAAYISYNRSTPNVPDFALYPTCMGKNSGFYDSCINMLGFKPYICEKVSAANREHEILVVPAVNLKPLSRGRVLLQSTDPLRPPLIYSGTFSDETDLLHYPAALRTARSVADTAYFRSKKARVIDLDIEECKGLRGVEMLRCTAICMATSAWHAVGTVAMGTVLDAKLRVRGIRGLRVADASVIPKVVRGNTNAPVVMIAEKAADFIKRSLSTW
ncbi:unnamed protein product [Leptosia nina]|uniref:Reverse transcriptase domain-containing protein n=1 Tax=Leptosia nina TaxID=320188 RepID=A0AAV1JE48_9NEOP